MRRVFLGMLMRMRNYALHHFDRIGPRTQIVLRDLGLFEDQGAPIGSDVDLNVLRDPNHPRREALPPGPLLLYLTEDEKPKRTVIDVTVLLYSEMPEVRIAALTHFSRMIGEGALKVTPKSWEIFEKGRAGLESANPHEWRAAAVALCDAFNDDIWIALQGARQSLASEPVIQDSLNAYAPRVLHPAVSSLDSIVLEVRDPQHEHTRLTEIIASVVGEAKSLAAACAAYHLRLGFLPFAPPYAMAEVVARWMAVHADTDAWKEVWDWTKAAFGPIPRYHACSVFVLHPEWVPAGALLELWREILGVAHEPGKRGDDNVAREPWALRRDLARHFAYHLEAHLPENDGAGIACFAWWFAEQVAALFPDAPQSAQFYRKHWIAPAAERSAYIWLAASPRIGRSYLRYVTTGIASPWATSLLALMGATLDQLAPQEQAVEIQVQFHEALVTCLIGALPVAVEAVSDPTYAMECALGQTAQKWAVHQSDAQRAALEQIAATSRKLGSVEALCEALRKLPETALPDQIAVALALKAKAHTDPTLAAGVWVVLADAEWRKRVFDSAEEQVVGRLIETLTILQVDNQGQWFSLLPHFIAEVCEKAENDERRRLLFLYVVHTSLASDTVSAVRRLLRGTHKAKFVDVVKAYRQGVESMWSHYPPWVQGRMRSLLANLHVV